MTYHTLDMLGSHANASMILRTGWGPRFTLLNGITNSLNPSCGSSRGRRKFTSVRMDILSYIEEYHTQYFVDRPLKRLLDSPDGVANPVYEIEDFLRDRIVLDPPKHADTWCDGSACPHEFGPDEVISGLEYYCLDCIPKQLDFCSKCVVSPGQGKHDPTHRLLQLLPTKCAICQGVTAIEEHPGNRYSNPYREYSAQGAALKRVAETRACGFCAFVWNALLQQPLDGIQWPPDEDKKVTIRIWSPRARLLRIVVLSDAGVKRTEIEIGGTKYVVEQRTSESEKELEVGIDVGKFGLVEVERHHSQLTIL